MVIWKNQQLTLILFGITVCFALTILLLCFLLCPILLSVIETKKAFDLRYITIFLSALVIWILLMACSCYIWLKRQKHKVNTQFTIHDNVDESDYEYCIEYDKQHSHVYPKESDVKKDIMFTDKANNHYVSVCRIPVQPVSFRKKNKSKRVTETESNNSYATLNDASLSEGPSNKNEEEPDKENHQQLLDYYEAAVQPNVQQTRDCASLPQPTSNEDEQLSQKQAPELTHEDSFMGLPELDPFDNYLHLVAIDTPLSPQLEFFPNN